MKPFTSGTVIAAWLLRILLAWFVYSFYFQTFAGFQLDEFAFYISAAYFVSAILIIAGGLSGKEGLTVVGGLVTFVLPVVQLIRVFPDDLTSMALTYLIPLATGFMFFSIGNNQ